MTRTNKSVKRFVEKALSKKTSVYYGLHTPKWIREKIDAQAGDTVSVSGLKDRYKEKPYPHFEEGYGYVDGKRMYNGTLLAFDGERWIIIAGGRINNKRKEKKKCSI